MAVSREELYFSHTNQFRRGVVEPWMLYQKKHEVAGFEMPRGFAKIMDMNHFYEIPLQYRQLLRMHSTKYRRGIVTPEMLYCPKVKYEEFEMPQAFADMMAGSEPMEEEQQTFKQKIEEMLMKKQRTKAEDQQEHKHPLKDLMTKLTNKA